MMKSTLWSRVSALFLAFALGLPSFAQEGGGQGVRPRRVTAPIAPPVTTRVEPADENITIRIGLATNARSATVSSAGQLLNATDELNPPVPLPTARVRLEPRLLAPLPLPVGDQYIIEIAGINSREEAARAAREINSISGEAAHVTSEEATKTWRVTARSSLARAEADELRARLEGAAYGDVLLRPVTPAGTSAPMSSAPPNSKSTNGVKLAARVSAPTREIVAYSANAATPVLRERVPVAFASDDERARPLKFNDKTYRGRIEVFANSRGTLTVVNVVKLEDYVRGVVPNELSPGSFPALEALKAQAIAARTYAVANRRQFAAQGFDLLPTTRSQVYGGASTEQALANRAVDETRGLIATTNGEPINAVYTSTCGGRTEHAENIFGGSSPSYLRGRECGPGADGLAAFGVRTTRDPAQLRAPEHRNSARDAALLAVHGFALGARLTDDWLAGQLSVDEARHLLRGVARLARQSVVPTVTDETLRPPQWASALAAALDGESRADVLLDRADIDYLLAFRDAAEIPAANRADVALFLRDEILELHPDATLRPRHALTRARALRTTARALEMRELFVLHKATTRPAARGALVLRPRESAGGGRSPERTLELSGDGFLFRALGKSFYPARELTIVGGEPAVYHTDARGRVDYLEVRPAPNGAAADHSSQFSFWTATFTPAEVTRRLARAASSVGPLVDLRVAGRGSSRRVIDLEIVGARGTARVRGGRIRSALGLREQLFVIDRRYDEAGRVASFVLTGRGLGHGVGMCQVGAYGLARAGWNFERILKAYYTNIELTKLY